MGMAKNKFSVIVPTYTGIETISGCFESILKQKNSDFEIVIIIDGPNDELRKIAKQYEAKFIDFGVDVHINQFKENKGRFIARLEGAKMAKYDQLLYLDDRITFKSNYFSTVSNQGINVVIPNVIEADAKNYISRVLNLMRQKIYGKKNFGTNFKSYAITQKNFEKSPKGTTSLWVPKKLFIDTCKQIQKNDGDSKYINEDTKIFKSFISNKIGILKCSKAKIFYHPRAGAWNEIKHLYSRGPRFVNYYSKPGTRFFIPLTFSLFMIVAFVLAAFAYPKLLMIAFIFLFFGSLVIGVAIAKNVNDILKVSIGLPIIFLSFYLGILKGIAIKIINRA